MSVAKALWAASGCITAFIALTLLPGITMKGASAASFDCTKAMARDSIAICSNPELSAKDDELGRVYLQRKVYLRSSDGDVHALDVEERRWLAMRLTCGDDLQCLNNWFDHRIADLRGDGSGTPIPPPTDPAFLEGTSDRENWEAWFSSLSGDYRAGAEYWATHRSERPRPSCNAHTLLVSPTWISGCLTAEARLTPTDQRRRREPLYRYGWNGLKPTAQSGTPSIATNSGSTGGDTARPPLPGVTQPQLPADEIGTGQTDWKIFTARAAALGIKLTYQHSSQGCMVLSTMDEQTFKTLTNSLITKRAVDESHARSWNARSLTVGMLMLQAEFSAPTVKHLYTDFSDADKCNFEVAFNSFDDFGQPAAKPLYTFDFSREIFSKINWEHFIPSNLAKIAASFKVSPDVAAKLKAEVAHDN